MAKDLDFDIETQALSQALDELDYFQLLGIPAGATAQEVKAAFHRLGRTFHPDRVFHESDPELKERVHRIYKRIAEAYYVLRDADRRAKYAADVSGPERARRLRYDEAAEQEVKRAKEEAFGVTPMGKKTFAAGLADLQAGRLDGAERNFRLAVAYEPDNANFREKLAEVVAVRKAAPGQAAGDPARKPPAGK